MSDNTKIQVNHVYKIFGSQPHKILSKVQAGAKKEDILAETGHTVGLHDVSLTIESGKIFVIMGLSGSGKSTLIRHFNRLIDPTAGEIIVDGENIMSLSRRALVEFRRYKISMVFQRFGLLPHHSVLQNVAYGLKVQGVKRDSYEEKSRYWIEQVGLSGYENAYPHELSGGMQQRVGLARALATDTDILLMDEAFSALDPLIRRDMQDQLIRLQKELQKTIVFITHDLDEALRLGDQIAILKDGEVIQVGSSEDILLNPATEYVEAFVKDVNRSRVITAATLMTRPATILMEDETQAEALNKMRNSNHKFAYVTNQKRELKGYVTLADLEKNQQKNIADCEEYLQSVPTVSDTTLLADILPLTLETSIPVVVTDDEGKIIGVIPRRSMIAALSEDTTTIETDISEPVSPVNEAA